MVLNRERSLYNMGLFPTKHGEFPVRDKAPKGCATLRNTPHWHTIGHTYCCFLRKRGGRMVFVGAGKGTCCPSTKSMGLKVSGTVGCITGLLR